jgi:hypothetical protein
MAQRGLNMVNYPALYPTWVANIQQYGVTIVNTVVIANKTNIDLWADYPNDVVKSETFFYHAVADLAHAWNIGINVKNAVFFEKHTIGGVAFPDYWAIPASGGHTGQFYVISEDALYAILSDTPNMRAGFTVPTDATFALRFCGNINIWDWDITPPVIDIINITGTKTDNGTGLPLQNWVITLENSAGTTSTDTTDVNGEYSFLGLARDVYAVYETIEPTWVCDVPDATGRYDGITSAVGSGTVNIVRDFKNHIPVAPPPDIINIRGKKTHFGTAQALSGWTITLRNAAGVIVSTTTTNANGDYTFLNLPIDVYSVTETKKTNWVCIIPDASAKYSGITAAVGSGTTDIIKNFVNNHPTENHKTYILTMILYPHPIIMWDQTWDMDMNLQKRFEKSYSLNMRLQKPFEVSQTLTALIQKTFTLPQYMSILVQDDFERPMLMSATVLRNIEESYELSMKLVLIIEIPCILDMRLQKTVEFSHLMYLNLINNGIECSQTMDMQLVHVPHRSYVIPQIWNLRTIEELATNSTGDVFDSRIDADREAAGG